ncbi:hypothetical protein BJX65DRAFT_303959 [Aspergillus insuetus]
MELMNEERRDLQLVMFVRGANLRWSFEEASEGEHVQSVESSQQPTENRGGDQPPKQPAPLDDAAPKNSNNEYDDHSAPGTGEHIKTSA